EAVAGAPVARGEVARPGVAVALGDERAALVDEMYEEHKVARRLRVDLPVQVDLQRLAGAQGRRAQLVAAQRRQRVEAGADLVGDRLALGKGRRSRVGGRQIAG